MAQQCVDHCRKNYLYFQSRSSAPRKNLQMVANFSIVVWSRTITVVTRISSCRGERNSSPRFSINLKTQRILNTFCVFVIWIFNAGRIHCCMSKPMLQKTQNPEGILCVPELTSGDIGPVMAEMTSHWNMRIPTLPPNKCEIISAIKALK